MHTTSEAKYVKSVFIGGLLQYRGSMRHDATQPCARYGDNRNWK